MKHIKVLTPNILANTLDIQIFILLKNVTSVSH